MASYGDWNSALLSYFVEGVPRGISVFLSVDDEVLRRVGRDFLAIQEHAASDFCRAVQQEVVQEGRVRLSLVTGRNAADEPRCLAFLAALVLGASRMAEEGEDEDEISAVNYFRRLRTVLELPPDDGRPPGLEAGKEEPLWHEWAVWLQERGYIPSARQGEGPRKYIDYPISQALLRSADKVRLVRLFADKRWPPGWEAEMVLGQVRREAPTLTRHLQELLRSPGQRYAAVAEAIYEVYTDWQDAPQPGHVPATHPSNAHLQAGLYRTEDPAINRVDFYLYPQAPRRRQADQIVVRVDGTRYLLRPDRPGWYLPLTLLSEVELDQGARYEIETPADLDWLILLQRQFWILVPDADNPESGVYHSWNSAPYGPYFMLLCRKELLPQLDHLRNERLISWEGAALPLFASGVWVEVQNCKVESDAWAGVSILNQGLYEALRPKVSVNVSAAGGLYVPGIGGWVEGYEPQITVISAYPVATVRIEHILDAQVIFEEERATGVPFPVTWPGAGDYRIEARCPGDMAQRLVKIIAWEQLPAVLPALPEGIDLEGWRVCGAYIERRASEEVSDDPLV